MAGVRMQTCRRAGRTIILRPNDNAAYQRSAEGGVRRLITKTAEQDRDQRRRISRTLWIAVKPTDIQIGTYVHNCAAVSVSSSRMSATTTSNTGST